MYNLPSRTLSRFLQSFPETFSSVPSIPAPGFIRALSLPVRIPGTFYKTLSPAAPIPSVPPPPVYFSFLYPTMSGQLSQARIFYLSSFLSSILLRFLAVLSSFRRSRRRNLPICAGNYGYYGDISQSGRGMSFSVARRAAPMPY